MQSQARKLSPRIVEGIQATKSAISSGTTSGWGSSLALQELSGAIIGGTERFGGFDAMEATRATQPRPVNTKFGFVVATAVGDEVAEANFKPATALSFATEALPERKSRASRPLPVRLPGHSRSQRSCRLCASRFGQSPLRSDNHFDILPLRPYTSISLST